MTLPAGTRLGPYDLVAPLGAGGMGQVYRARDTRLGRDVAIKVVNAAAGSPDAVARFEREGRAIAALNHPNICMLFDVGASGGHPYLVMELLEGSTLHDVVARGPMPVAALIDHGIALADALHTAAPAPRSGPQRTCRPSDCAVRRSTCARICSRLASC
jgi:serine/threonine protein kinase